MKHRMGFNRLGRSRSARLALYKAMVNALFKQERIRTTQAKAKEIRRVAERMITRARSDTVHNRRLIARSIGDRAVLTKLFTDIAPRFAGRPGGYTRILKLGRRPGDGAEMAILEFIDFDFAQRQAEKKVAAKAAAEKKETLLEKAKKLVTGKGAEEKAGKGEKAEKAESAEAVEGGEKAEKKAKPAEKPHGVKGPRAPKGSGKKGGGTHGGTPRKVGGG